MSASMGIGGTPFTGRQLTRIGILFAAVILAMISLFVAWWGVTFITGGIERPVEAKPFSGFDGDDELGSEAVLTGVFALLATLAVLAYLGMEIMAAMGRTLAPLYALIPPAAAFLFGLTAVLYTALAWPAGASNENVGFFDSREDSVPGLGAVKRVFSPSVGWYFAVLGLIVAPATTFWLGLRETGMPRMTDTTPSAAVPAAASMRSPAPVAPPPAAAASPRVATKRPSQTGDKRKSS